MGDGGFGARSDQQMSGFYLFQKDGCAVDEPDEAVVKAAPVKNLTGVERGGEVEAPDGDGHGGESRGGGWVRGGRHGRLPDEITQVFQFHGQIDITDHDVFRGVEDGGGKIEDGLQTGHDQLIDDLLGGHGWDGENGHFDVMFLDERAEFLDGFEGDGGQAGAGALDIGVEGGDDFEPFFIETAVAEEGGAEVPDADEDDWLEAVGAEHVIEHAGEVGHAVTESPSAELAEVGEVFAQLRWFDAGGAGQGL